MASETKTNERKASVELRDLDATSSPKGGLGHVDFRQVGIFSINDAESSAGGT